MGELTKTDNAGKNSPGPVYLFNDGIKYDNVSLLFYFICKIFIHIKFIIGSRMVNGN
jgi:hypothetical protein